MKLTSSFYESLDQYLDLSGNEFYGCAEQDENYCGEICPSPCYLGAEDCESDLFAGEDFSQLLSGEL